MACIIKDQKQIKDFDLLNLPNIFKSITPFRSVFGLYDYKIESVEKINLEKDEFESIFLQNLSNFDQIENLAIRVKLNQNQRGNLVEAKRNLAKIKELSKLQKKSQTRNF